jgi:nucleoside-diphosphate kinase
MERTLTIIKNESIKRGLVGSIINKIESTGLRLAQIKQVTPTLSIAKKHYIRDLKWIKGLGEKAKTSFKNSSKLVKVFGTEDEISIGEKIYQWSLKQLANKEIIVIVWEGNNAVAKVKKIVGENEPSNADLSTVRGMFSSDSYLKSNLEGRALYNVVHRSSNLSEAKREIKVWFGK